MRAPMTARMPATRPWLSPRANSMAADGGSRAAPHAVIDGHHLGHVGHLHLLAGNPGQDGAQAQGHDHQGQVLEARHDEGGEDGQHHADAGPDDAGPGRSGGTHALETEDEQQGAGEIGGLDVDRQRHHAPSFFLNMPSMRSVTT